MTMNDTSSTAAPMLFQSTYGLFRPRFLWFLSLPTIVGLIGVPVGLFYNEGWVMNNHPLEPWSAMLIIEIFSVGALMTVAFVVICEVVRRKSPQRVAVTESSLIVPKGRLSSTDLTLPLSEIKVAVFDMGFVKQLQIKHKRRKILLSSALFPSTADFNRLVSHLPR
jgi:hypothetical protein